MNSAVFNLVPSADVVVERYAPGTVLFTEGERPRGIHLIYSGRVDLVFSARNGNEKPLRVAGTGQVLGLSAVVSGIQHDCAGIARTRCTTGFIAREAFSRALSETPELWLSVLSVLSHNLAAVYDDLRERAAG